MVSSAGLVVSSAKKRRTPIVGQHHQHFSKFTQVQKGMHLELNKLKAPRGVHSATPPPESPPATKSPPPVLRERPKPTQPSPPTELVTLRQIVTNNPHVVKEGMHTLQAHTERNTTIVNCYWLQQSGCMEVGQGDLC